ncbi:MAG TPA: imidazoleglycerol-phosphate dehydratase HisB [Candidatus Limnocylindrales bacterium]|nr:imidazoleglycerol-phosphate dehydratase HisB [Candidatus Limnocylindrales bacterium]
MGRFGAAERSTSETSIRVAIELDGVGRASVDTGVGFLDHMLQLLARHSLIDIEMSGQGDLQVDDHHTVEDCGIVLGRALDAALNDRAGIRRYGDVRIPMDEALAECAIDVSGRSLAVIRPRPSALEQADPWLELVPHMLESLAREAGITLHLEVRGARSRHHHCEAMVKAFARALRQAIEPDPRLAEAGSAVVPSTKGSLR